MNGYGGLKEVWGLWWSTDAARDAVDDVGAVIVIVGVPVAMTGINGWE